jgi:UDP-sugar transporter A1/2/3
MASTGIKRLLPLLRTSWDTLAATLLMTIQPFLTVATKNANGDYSYSFLVATFLSEAFKLVIACALYAQPATRKSHGALKRRDILMFAIPAFVYFVNNNLVFYTLMYMSSTTFQILSSLKTVATGILFRVILKRMLSDVQRAAIILLACGAATSQFPVCICPACAVCDTPMIMPSNASTRVVEADQSVDGDFIFMGIVLALVACFNSAFGGVYAELLLKKDGDLHSIHLQNIMLYAWGVLFNAAAMLAKDGEQLRGEGIFGGFTLPVWLLITNNALSGLAISAILKFADNIVRVFAHTAAMMLTMILELAFMNAPFTPQLCVSITVVSCSTYLYNLKPPPPPPPPSTQLSSEGVRQMLDEDAEFETGQQVAKPTKTRRSNKESYGRALEMDTTIDEDL